MAYKVLITEGAERDLEGFICYLLYEKKSAQAAGNLLDDFEATQKVLEQAAGSLRYCENSRLAKAGYRRINFRTHRYFMLYRLEGQVAIVDNIFHELQDYEGKMC